MRLVATGLSHRTAPIELREKLAQSTTQLEATLRDIRRHTTIEEACVISTCNRVEFYVSGQAEPPALARDVRRFIQASSGLAPQHIDPHLYEHQGQAGLRHLFRVAASLDSMVLGEPQILGQVKEAYQVAFAQGATGTALTRAFQRAFAVAKRVRTETGIAENAVSMSFAAVELGREIFTSLEGKNVLLVGAGKMSTLAARHLKSQGVGEIRVCNRSLERAVKLAEEIGGTASSLADLEMLLGRADIVISSTAASGYVIDKKLMQRVLRERRYRSILLIDLAVPRDIDPAIADLDNAFVYDVDALDSVVEVNREARAKEAEAAERIVEEEITSFIRWSRSQQVVPVIKALRDRAITIAQAEAERTLGSIKDPNPRVEQSVRAMSQAIVNKLLHPVFARLKQEGAEGDPETLVVTLESLFDLTLEPEAPATSKPEAPATPSNVVPIRGAGESS